MDGFFGSAEMTAGGRAGYPGGFNLGKEKRRGPTPRRFFAHTATWQ
jgi:hypothetical protein